MLPIETLRRFTRNCDPARPVGPDDPLYVDLDAGAPVRGDAGQSCVGELLRTLQLAEPTDESCQLFTGFRGSGKTTELRRLARALEQDRETSTRTLLVDFEEYVDLTSPISIVDVLRVMAWSLDREATIVEGKDPDARPGYVQRLIDLLRTDVNLGGATIDVGGLSFMLELRDNPRFAEKVSAALSNRFQQFARDAQQAMREAVLRIRKHTAAQRVVVIADSLEKIAPVFEHSREAVENSAEALFIQHARLLQLPCHVIYTFPWWIGYRTASFGAHYAQEPVMLPMIRVASPGGPAYAPGLDKLQEMVARRVDLAQVFGPDLDTTLLPILRASGGYPRDLLRMVREMVMHANSFPVTPRDAERVIDRLADDYAEVVRSTDLEALAHVARSHALPMSTAEEIRTFGTLIGRFLVLTYRNGKRWYDVHPLVRRVPQLAARIASLDAAVV